ncbi:MAG: hypothetical protein U1E65_17095 [Myxococcota bacterium]
MHEPFGTRTLLLSCLGLAACGGAGDNPLATERGPQAITDERAGHGLPPIRPGQYPGGAGTPSQHRGSGPSGSWTTMPTTPPTVAAGFSILLTDGSVMVQDLAVLGGDWWRLRPDAHGNYLNGSWTQLPSMPGGYAPLYFASAVLADGRVIFVGGEYQAFTPAWQTQGAIFDPVSEQWTLLDGPPGWQTVGDAQSVVLADGRFILANCCTTEMAVLDPATLTWSSITSDGKVDIFDEEGWTLLPNGKVLTTDSNNFANLTNSEIYTPPSAGVVGGWQSAGSTIVQIADTNADGSGSWEVGPAMLRPDGTVFQTGGTGHTAIYDVRRGSWRAGPDFPAIAGEGQLTQADGPAALLPNGNVLVAASPGVFNVPAHFLEFDGHNLFEVDRPADAVVDSSFNINLLLLPTGEVLETDFSADVEIYSMITRSDVESPEYAPSIENPGELRNMQRGGSYRFRGIRLHGISSGVSYGDDAQAATNYPLIKIRNRATGHVTYARTHGFSNFSIHPQARSEAWMDIPANIETGDSDLVAIVNGIHSHPVRTRIR